MKYNFARRLIPTVFFTALAGLSAGCLKSGSSPISQPRPKDETQVTKWNLVTFDPPRRASAPIWAEEHSFHSEIADFLAREQQIVAFEAYLNLWSTEAKDQIRMEMVEKGGDKRKAHFEAARAKGKNGADNVIFAIICAETNGNNDYAFVQVSTQPFTGSLSEAKPFPSLRLESLVRNKKDGTWKFGGLLKSKDCPVAQFLFTLRPTEIAKNEATLIEKMNSLLQSD